MITNIAGIRILILLLFQILKSLDCFIDPFQYAQLGERGLGILAQGPQHRKPSTRNPVRGTQQRKLSPGDLAKSMA